MYIIHVICRFCFWLRGMLWISAYLWKSHQAHRLLVVHCESHVLPSVSVCLQAWPTMCLLHPRCLVFSRRRLLFRSSSSSLVLVVVFVVVVLLLLLLSPDVVLVLALNPPIRFWGGWGFPLRALVVRVMVSATVNCPQVRSISLRSTKISACTSWLPCQGRRLWSTSCRCGGC